VRVLFDIVHPAHAHFYRHLHARLLREGHECHVLARNKEVTLQLLDDFGIPYETHGRPRRWRIGQAQELAARDLRLYRIGRRFKPDFVLARNPAGTHAARALGAVGVFDTDDGRAAGLVFKLAAPFAHVITTPECISEDFGAKHLRYPGYKALAFLHPDEFQPDPEVRDRLGVGDERFGIVRLTAMDSAHDRNQQGVPRSLARELIGRLERDMRVFVSSEGPLPDEWAHLGFPIAPRYMLDAMAAASIVVGDSGSMIAEAAMLGTPAVFLGSFAHKRTYLVDLETTWGLTRVFLPDESDDMLAVVAEIVDDPESPAIWQERRGRMLAHTVDVSKWYYDLLTSLHERGVAATLTAQRALRDSRT
jgi:predicted glycosyltransferase